MHDKLRERCNNAGYTINDWIDAAIKYLLTGSSEFDFGDPDYDEDEPEEVSEKKEITKGTIISFE